MISHNKIVILIPCRNEEKGVSKVIDGLPIKSIKKSGYKTDVIVIDNNSTDSTAAIAKKHGAKVVFEKKKGKGNAIMAGFKFLPSDTKFVVIIDGDNTYKSNEIMRLIEPLENNFADIIIGSRLSGKTEKGSLKFEHRLANWFYTFLVRHFCRVNTTDVLSGFVALKRKVVVDLFPHIQSSGFAIEMEVNIKASKMRYKIFSVPITYDVREGESKIEKFRDSFHILYAFFKYLIWKP